MDGSREDTCINDLDFGSEEECDEVPNKKPRKRLKVGELSGRQMALRKIKEEEEKRALVQWNCRFPPPFGATVLKMRAALMEFTRPSQKITPETASAMRIYCTRKLDIDISGGSTCVLTNYFKVATLPQHLYSMALQIIMLYEEGELVPPTDSTQRKRRELSSSSFNFLRGLNPLNEDDFPLIESCLNEWRRSGVRPESAAIKGNKEKANTQTVTKKQKDAEREELQRVKIELKEAKATAARRLKEITLLEKKLCDTQQTGERMEKRIKCFEKQSDADAKLISFLKEENAQLKEELEAKELVPHKCRYDKIQSVKEEDRDSFEPAALKREHETKAALLQTLRQRKPNDFGVLPGSDDFCFDNKKQANDIRGKDDLSFGTEEPVDLREGRMVQDLQVQDDFQGNSTEVPEEDIVSCVKEEPKEEWVAVSYGSLMYVGRIVKESENIVTVRFLRRVDGCYQTMKNNEEVPKEQVFLRNVTVTWQGVGRFDVPDIRTISASHKKHCQIQRMAEKAHRIWDLNDDSDLDERVSSYGGGLTLYDIKTIQPVVPMVEQIRMRHHSLNYQEGWLNDKVISASLEGIADEAKRKGKRVIAASSFITEMFKKKDGIERVSKWMEKENVLMSDFILVPINSAAHWTLGVVNVKEKKLLHYDSRTGLRSPNGQMFFACIRQLLRTTHLSTDWREVSPTTPQQPDSKSCGVYVIKVAESVVNGNEPHVTQEDLTTLRYKLTIKLAQ